ncbi:aldo/keto reductase [Laspinema olomoucense]|uniref:aldo/keto reductase n=1 Tax=Laspinema olomoucense TaxID=3231600 RepID=UPI0021BB8391|nr:aldo/keto reductase [Laspinema sp. D3c]MCT7993612.1 aldo/keto reductase [Laspinema sp. D3c]
MELIQLGNNGPTVPTLGIGAWSWGDTLFWNFGKDYGVTQVREAFQAAVEAGITFFDTAEVYGLGKSEQLLGQFIRETETPIQVATKYGPLPWRFTAESVAEALTDSLDRLQLTQVTLYQVHWPFTFLMSQETLMNALADEVEKGRIQTIGVSNYSAAQMREAHAVLSKRGIPLAVNQVRYSLLSREVETQGIIKTARELGITILAYSPLQQGLLTGKYTPDGPQPTGARQWDSRFKPEGLRKIAPVLDLLRQFGQNYGKTPAQVALNWLIAQGGIIPIPGAKNAEQARQNAGAVGWQLTANEVAQLEQVTRPWL